MKDGKFITEGEQISIDDGTNYESLCGECYLRKVKKMKGWY